jgi:hypothetical protein
MLDQPDDDILSTGEAFAGTQYVNRVTVRIEVIRHRGDHQPAMVYPKFVRKLQDDGDVYQRRGIKITAAGELQTYFIEAASWIVIENTTRWMGGVVPSAEEQAEIAGRWLHIGPPERPDWLTLRPGEAVPLPVALPVIVTPVNGDVEIAVMALPE